MNIQDAKDEIIHTLQAYHRKDATGNYCFPVTRQRPILLMGPPGIGKTAIMEQIAAQCGVGLVAYTITHHTRQSAVGLPKIVTRTYDGQEVSVTEYTLSEIIASVYDCIERTGKREGILFIDEINCASETLAPTMLQFLQNKKFGSHKVPDGWMIVAAGNPPEYNKSVREFDIVTLDRVRRLELEPDLEAWMAYAWEQEVHGAILSYLNLKKDHFYQIHADGEEKQFVTARGWEDLSEILKNYEAIGVSCGSGLMGQYLQEPDTAREFAAYYQLYQKYGADYGIREILDGVISPEKENAALYEQKVKMAGNAGFEERCTVIHLLLDGLAETFNLFCWLDDRAVKTQETLKQLKKELEREKNIEYLEEFVGKKRQQLRMKEQMELGTKRELHLEWDVLQLLETYQNQVKLMHLRTKEEGMECISQLFKETVSQRTDVLEQGKQQLTNAFRFVAACFGEDQEMILLVSGLTKNRRAMDFIRVHGCPEYLKFSEVLVPEDADALQKACLEQLEMLTCHS